MAVPDAAEAVKVLKMLVATLVLLLILTNVFWYMTYISATNPALKATVTPSPTPTPTATFTPSTTVTASPTMSATPLASPTPAQ